MLLSFEYLELKLRAVLNDALHLGGAGFSEG
jgi:hypothetical protein